MEPQINGPEQVGLKITANSGVKGGMIRIGYSIIDSLLVSAIKKNHIKKEDFELTKFARNLAEMDKEKLDLMRKIDTLERLVSKIRRRELVR